MTEDPVKTVEETTKSPEIKNNWDIFFPGIENNMIFVHGTPTNENRDSIIEKGLKPPNSGPSARTLARNVHYSRFHRYSGGDGYIFVLRLDEDDLKHGARYITQSSEFAIGEAEVIRPEKIEVIIPTAESKLFSDLQTEYRLAIEKTEITEPKETLENISELSSQYIEKAVHNLADQGNFINGKKTKDELSKLAQELVWNQLNASARGASNNLKFYSEEYLRLDEEDFIYEMNNLIGDKPDWKKVKRSFKFIEALHQEEGSGFDNIPLSDRVNIEATNHLFNWLDKKEKLEIETQKTMEKIESQSKLSKLLGRLLPQKPPTQE